MNYLIWLVTVQNQGKNTQKGVVMCRDKVGKGEFWKLFCLGGTNDLPGGLGVGGNYDRVQWWIY